MADLQHIHAQSLKDGIKTHRFNRGAHGGARCRPNASYPAHVNRPETFAALVDKLHSYGIMVFGLFMYGFDGDDISVFDETVNFNINTKYDAFFISYQVRVPGYGVSTE